jgi:hypothetical protein
MKIKIIRRCLYSVVFAGGAWWSARAYFRENWNWPLSLAFGALTVLAIGYVISRWAAGKPAPFQLVLRLADDEGGDQEDDQTFKALRNLFKRLFPKSGSIRFDGFDTDRSFIWFYFHGPDEASVRDAVLPHLKEHRIRPGSYFLSKATQPCGSPNDGSATQLGNSGVTEGMPSLG